MIPNKTINPVLPPYKFQPQPFENPLGNNNKSNQIQPQNVIITPDNFAKKFSELIIEDSEEAASLIFDIVEKDYPK
jgi:hypothetical protein